MTRLLNPQMLELARDYRGMTQSKLAQRVRVNQGRISRYQASNEPILVDDEFIEALSRELKFPPSFFELPDRKYGLGSPCLYYRKRQSLPVTASKRIHAVINLIRICLMRLFKSVEIDHDNAFSRLDMDEYPGGPEQVARFVRTALGLPAGPVRNLVTTVENAGGVVIPCDFGTRKADAVSQWPPELPLPPLFFINVQNPSDRTRWTLAHEMGHVFMHGIGIPPCDLEREANQFAAELLMPKRDIITEFGQLTMSRLADLKQHWKVSMAALLHRAQDLEVISEWQARVFWQKMSQAGYRTEEPVELPTEEPTVVREILKTHFDELGYTTDELSETLSQYPNDFESLFATVFPDEQGPPMPFRMVN